MKTDLTTHSFVVVASGEGRCHLLPPRAPSGELECFSQGEAIALIVSPEGSIAVTAPWDGFVIRYHVIDGAWVERNEPVAVLRRAG